MSVNVARVPRSFRDEGRVRYDGVYMGVIKDNVDPTRMGRVSVYIPELSGSPTDPASWITCSYASTFAGATPFRPESGGGELDGQQSYGWWATPPDLDNLVLVCFVDGDPARAFWFACVYQQRMNHMVPGIAVNRVREASAGGGGAPAASPGVIPAGGGTAGGGTAGGGTAGGGTAGAAAQPGGGNHIGQTPFGPYNVGYYRTLPEAQEGARRYTDAANFARANPHLYNADEMRATLRLEAAANAEVARLSGGAAGGVVAAGPRPAAISTQPQAEVRAAQGATAGASPTARGNSAQRAAQFFTNQGWSPDQAAGIVGALVARSDLDPSATGGDAASPARGIGLWDDNRLAQFARFAQERGYPTDPSAATLEQQLAFVQDELTRPGQRTDPGQAPVTNPLAALGERLRGLSSPAEVAAAVVSGGLLPNGPPLDPARASANAVAAREAARGPNNTDPAARADQAVPQPARPPATAAQRNRRPGGGGQNPREWAPVIEYNKVTDTNPDRPRRVAFEPLAAGLETQGLVQDRERGPSSTSARRESPSRVYGYLTPRGNTVHVDDNDKNEFIRLRTRSGVQVLIHETTGFVYINSKDGNAWLEISDRGVDIYSQNSVSIRAEQNLNVRADKSIIFDAGNMISMRAANGIFLESGKGITAVAQQNVVLGAGGRLALVSEGDMTQATAANWRSQAASDMTQKSGGRQVRQGSSIRDNSDAAPDATPPEFGVPRAAALHGVETTVTRMPTREPWPEHPRSDVPPARVADDGDISGRAANPNGPGAAGPDARRGEEQQSGEGDNLPVTNPNMPRCHAGARTIPVSTEVFNSIKEASDRTGVPFGYLMATAHQESSFNPTARAQTSSAGGLFQFIDGTWNSMVRSYGAQFNVGPGDRFDPRASALMGAQYARVNADTLRRNGLPAGNTELYMAHFLGAGGATTMLREFERNPNRPAAEVNPRAAASNRTVFFRPDGTPRTVAEVRSWAEQKIEPRAQAYARQAGQPAPCERDGATVAAAPAARRAAT